MALVPKGKISKHFSWDEFVREWVTDLPIGILDNLKRLALRLEAVRERLGNKPITITSGYRDPAHNARVGGKRNSTHLLGMAADIQHATMTPKQVQKALADWPGGMGYGNSFTHLDIRARKARWYY